MSFRIRNACPSCLHPQSRDLHREAMDGPLLRGYLESHYMGRARLDAVRGAEYRLVRCLGCGLAYQRVVPDDAFLAEIYDAWIPASERERLLQRSTLDTFRYLSEQVDHLIQRSGCLPWRLEVLDFGLGWSEWARMAAAYGCHVYGTELSQLRRDHARRIGLEVLEADDLGVDRFDYINTEQVFEHLTDPRQVLLDLAAALKPGGRLKISVPNCRAALARLAKTGELGRLTREQLKDIAPLEHINCFEHTTLRRLAEQAGLRLDRPDLRQLYSASAGWFSLRRAGRLVARSLYRHVYPGSTFLHFVKPGR